MLATRNRVLQDALADHALLIASHIATPGRITQTKGGGLLWSDAWD